MINSKLKKNSSSVFLILLTASFTGMLLSTKTGITHMNQSAYGLQMQQGFSSLPDSVTIQNTSMSIPAPNSVINNQAIPHQIVIGLPLREDGKVWVGTVTFSASKPIEIEVEQLYKPEILPDAKHGAPYNARWIDNTTHIALAPITMFTNTPVTITNTPISTGSLAFAGSALVFHKTSGDPFTVTYTIDATAKPLTQNLK